MKEAVRVGLIGCGNISAAYLKAAPAFTQLEIVACTDIFEPAAKRTEETFGVRAMGAGQLLARDDIEVVLNLTVPGAHAEVNTAALESGKHAYCEKPFALDPDAGRGVLALAESAGLRVGCAPDTFLGGGQQTVRQVVDTNEIGRPIAATAFMMGHGHESWHPDPEFYYQPGGGPLFDMGPYYLTALINVLGPVKRVAALTGRGFDTRTITSEPKAGKVIGVEVDTHAAGTLEFHNGAIVTTVMSFDVWMHSNRFIELHGSDGSLSAPDPNSFGGTVRVCGSERTWSEVPLTHGYTDNMRGIGLADMCDAIRTGRQHRCSGELAFHVLEVMDAFGRSSRDGSHIDVASKPDRPAPLPQGLDHGELDE